MIEGFSSDVCSKIGFYVYRLIDLRNGQTFYVVKGKDNRIFEHVKGALKNPEETDKCEIIREILREGLDVIHVIQCWNLTNKEAFEVESALIDAYPGLSNIQKGHHHEFGVTNVEAIQKSLGAKVYVEPDDFKYIIIKVNNWSIEQEEENNVADPRYESTRKWWNLGINKVKGFDYVFSVSYGIVKAVYKVEKWEKYPNINYKRIGFHGEDAGEEIKERFIGKRIPETYRKKGKANPCLYSKNTLKDKSKT